MLNNADRQFLEEMAADAGHPLCDDCGAKGCAAGCCTSELVDGLCAACREPTAVTSVETAPGRVSWARMAEIMTGGKR